MNDSKIDEFQELIKDYRAMKAPPDLHAQIMARVRETETPGAWRPALVVAASLLLAAILLIPLAGERHTTALSVGLDDVSIPSLSELIVVRPREPSISLPSMNDLPAMPTLPASLDTTLPGDKRRVAPKKDDDHSFQHEDKRDDAIT